MKTKLIAAFITLTVSSPVLAQTKIFTMIGEPDCGKWINQNSIPNKAWLLGFLSGVNITFKDSKDALGKVNAEQTYLWMDNYCKKNPLEQLATGAIDLYVELVMKK